MEIKGVICDVDGVLLDSMQAWHRAPVVYLKELGITADPHVGHKLFALKIEDSARVLKELYDLPEGTSEIVEGINSVVKRFYLTEAELKPGARELLLAIKEYDIPAVVGSSTDRELIEAAFNRLDLGSYFKRIFTCTEVGHPKSDPDLFIEAMAFMGTSPEETLLIEDGLYSMKTAHKLGVRLMGIYDEISAGDQEEIREISDYYIDKGERLDRLVEELPLCRRN